jgi:hypothetical protein
MRACDKRRRLGYNAAEENFDAINDELNQIGEKTFHIPAHTMAGVMVKIQALKMMTIAEDFSDEWWLPLEKDFHTLVIEEARRGRQKDNGSAMLHGEDA